MPLGKRKGATQHSFPALLCFSHAPLTLCLLTVALLSFSLGPPE